MKTMKRWLCVLMVLALTLCPVLAGAEHDGTVVERLAFAGQEMRIDDEQVPLAPFTSNVFTFPETWAMITGEEQQGVITYTDPVTGEIITLPDPIPEIIVTPEVTPEPEVSPEPEIIPELVVTQEPEPTPEATPESPIADSAPQPPEAPEAVTDATIEPEAEHEGVTATETEAPTESEQASDAGLSEEDTVGGEEIEEEPAATHIAASELICLLEENDEHTHGAACYATDQETEEQSVEEDAEEIADEQSDADLSVRDVVIGCEMAEELTKGDPITLVAQLIGYDDCEVSLQWQYDYGDGWMNAPGESTGLTYHTQVDKLTIGASWRLEVTVIEQEQAASEDGTALDQQDMPVDAF